MLAVHAVWKRAVLGLRWKPILWGTNQGQRRAKQVGRPESLEPRALLAINPLILEESESNNSFSTANPLGVTANNSVLAVGTISVGDVDYFSVTVSAGSKIWAYTDTGGASNVTANSSRDTVLTLYSTNGTSQLKTNDDGGASNGGDDDIESTLGSVISGETVSTAGTYYIAVQALNSARVINPYKLFVSVTTGGAVFESFTSNGTSATAETIDPANPLRGGSTSTGDVDFYSFRANAGDQVLIFADANPLRISTTLQLNVSLAAADGSNMASGAQTSTSSLKATAINYRLVTGGTYFVRLSTVPGAATGDYSLLVQVGSTAKYYPEKTGNNDGAPNAQAILSPLIAPLVMVGSLESGDVLDTYSFYAPAGKRLWVFAETGGIQNRSTVFVRDVGLAVLRQNSEGLFETIVSKVGGGSGSGDDNDQETRESTAIPGTFLQREGVYFINILRGALSVNDNTKVVSPYRLFIYLTDASGNSEVEPNDAPSQADPIGGSSGSVREGFLSINDIDYYSVDLRAGEIVWMVINGDPQNDNVAVDATLGFFAPDGTTRLGLTANLIDNTANQVIVDSTTFFEAYSYRAIVSGRYFIRVARTGSRDATYQLMASIVSPYNLAPVLDTSGSTFAIFGAGSRQSAEMRAGTSVAEILSRGGNGSPIGDGDMGATPGIAITSVDSSLGTLQFTLVANDPDESDWRNVTAAGAVSDSSALLLPSTARLRFSTTRIPHHDSAPVFLPLESKLDNGFRFRAWDQTTGVVGQRADVRFNGSFSAFSLNTESVRIYFEARLFRHFNRNAALNVYTLEAEFNALSGGGAFEDRSTFAFTGFTVLLSAVPELGTVPLYRLYYGVQFNANGTEVDMGYRYLTSNLSEVNFLESIGPADKRPQRAGTYFRELGVNAGTAILGYLFSSQQPGTSQLTQIYRTDIVQKPTRPPGTSEGGTPTSFTPQENGDHVYTTNTAVETSKPGTWRVESTRGFTRELFSDPNSATAISAPAVAAASSQVQSPISSNAPVMAPPVFVSATSTAASGGSLSFGPSIGLVPGLILSVVSPTVVPAAALVADATDDLAAVLADNFATADIDWSLDDLFADSEEAGLITVGL
jgi:hypothetical protein